MSDRATLSSLINGYGVVFDTLVRHLHARGLVSRSELSDELGKQADEIEAAWTDVYPPGTVRLDVSIVRSMAAGVRVEDYAHTVIFGRDIGINTYMPSNDE